MTNRDQVELALKATIAEILPELPAVDILLSKSLRDLGADSVDRVEIITLLTHRLGSVEPISKFSEMSNLEELISFLSTESD